MEKKKIKASSDKDSKAENGAEGFQTIDDELPVSKEKKKKKHKEKANGDSMNANFQELNEIEEKSPRRKKKKREKKTEGEETEAEEEISEKTDEPEEEAGVSKKNFKYFYGSGKEGFEGTPSKYIENKEAKVKKKKKRPDEAEIEEKVEITKEQDSKKAAPEEVTSYPDLENREKDSRKKKKNKRSGEAEIEEKVEITKEQDSKKAAPEEVTRYPDLENREKASRKKKKNKRSGEAEIEEKVEITKEQDSKKAAPEEVTSYPDLENRDNAYRKKKKKKRSGEAEIEEKVEITKEQDSKKAVSEEVTSYPDLENSENASRKKKKKKSDEDNEIVALKNLEEEIEDRTAKEEEKSEKSHKKKKRKRVEGNDAEAVENSEEGIEYGTTKGEDNTEKSPKEKGEAHEKVEEKKKKRKKNDEGQCYSNVERNEKMTKKRKRRELVSDNANRGKSSPADKSPPSKKQKKVTFSDQVEVFLISDREKEEKGKDCDDSAATSVEDSEVVWGKRFSKVEDNAIRNAISAYIKERGYEEEKGLHMVLNCMKNSEVRNCWKQIAASLPWRPLMSVYLRAHVLYERSENRGWTKDEISALKSLQAEHGNNWKKISEFLGKSRYHVKDKWRRIKRQGLNSGNWSRDEYQKLFDLVNQNMQLKSLEKEEKPTRNVLRDNINWEAIADKMETRDHVHCCKKWYYSLVSSMVQTGEWENEDDITLLRSLLETNASDEEAVDWDALVEGRSGVTCLKRWKQMVKHLGECHSMPFLEKLEMLVKRYIPDLIE